MNPLSLIASLTRPSSQQAPKALRLEDGQVLKGSIQKVLSDKLVVVSFNGQQVTAELSDVDLNQGTKAWFQVDTKTNPVSLKLLQSQSDPSKSTSAKTIEGLLASLELPDTPSLKALLRELVQEKLPISKDFLLQSEEVFNTLSGRNREDVVVRALVVAYQRNLPITSATIAALVTTAEGKSFLSIASEVSALTTQFLGSSPDLDGSETSANTKPQPSNPIYPPNATNPQERRFIDEAKPIAPTVPIQLTAPSSKAPLSGAVNQHPSMVTETLTKLRMLSSALTSLPIKLEPSSLDSISSRPSVDPVVKNVDSPSLTSNQRADSKLPPTESANTTLQKLNEPLLPPMSARKAYSLYRNLPSSVGFPKTETSYEPDMKTDSNEQLLANTKNAISNREPITTHSVPSKPLFPSEIEQKTPETIRTTDSARHLPKGSRDPVERFVASVDPEIAPDLKNQEDMQRGMNLPVSPKGGGSSDDPTTTSNRVTKSLDSGNSREPLSQLSRDSLPPRPDRSAPLSIDVEDLRTSPSIRMSAPDRGTLTETRSDALSSSQGHKFLDFLLKLGLNHEKSMLQSDRGLSESDSFPSHPFKTPSIESIKALTLDLLKNPALLPENLKDSLETLLNQITGQQLMASSVSSGTASVNADTFLTFAFQFPIVTSNGDESNVLVQFESKRSRSDELDPDNCRLFFYLTLGNIGETMVDVSIVNRNLNVTLFNQEDLASSLKAFKQPLTELLQSQGYYLSSLKSSPLTSCTSPKNEPSLTSIQLNSYEGVDFRI